MDTRFKKVECFDGETGYLEDNVNKELHSHNLKDVTFLIDLEEDRVYRVVTDHVRKHMAIVVPIRDSELTKKVIADYMKDYSRMDERELKEYLKYI